MKHFVFLSAGGVENRAAFQQAGFRALSEWSQELPSSARLIVNVVGDRPERLPYRPTVETGPHFDLIVEAEDLNGSGAWLARLSNIVPDAARRDVYLVDPIVELDRQPEKSIGVSPGIKYIGLLEFHADLPDSAARRSWGIHANLAVDVHVGMDKYVRNWVVEAPTPNCKPARGISELHFPSEEAITDRFFDSERGMREILHDTSHFVASGARSFVSEHVLRL